MLQDGRKAHEERLDTPVVYETNSILSCAHSHFEMEKTQQVDIFLKISTVLAESLLLHQTLILLEHLLRQMVERIGRKRASVFLILHDESLHKNGRVSDCARRKRHKNNQR